MPEKMGAANVSVAPHPRTAAPCLAADRVTPRDQLRGASPCVSCRLAAETNTARRKPNEQVRTWRFRNGPVDVKLFLPRPQASLSGSGVALASRAVSRGGAELVRGCVAPPRRSRAHRPRRPRLVPVRISSPVSRFRPQSTPRSLHHAIRERSASQSWKAWSVPSDGHNAMCGFTGLRVPATGPRRDEPIRLAPERGL
jgi:hypothetical protein